MLQTIKKQLLQIVEDIDAGNSNAEEADLIQIADVLRRTLRKDFPMSKYQAYTYLNISRATFDNYVRAGKIPKGKKVQGFRELRWYKKDLMKLKKQ
jgi:predicted DNA-binding transcriptional regulator AlpA